MSILTDLVGLTSDSTSNDPLIQAWKMIKGQQQDDPANAQPVTHKVTYNPDGSQDHTVNASVAKPVEPAQDYNSYIAQQESGANPNIGYHDPNKRSAYGTYGITAQSYQDFQAANPAFAVKDITSLSPEEQRAANDVLKAQYAQQLTAKGVDPTEANLRLAHLLGAGGAHQYLTQGTFNQAAMDANGGPEQLQKIAQQRLASAGGQLPQQAQAQAPARPVPPQQPGVQLAASGPTSDVGPTPNEMAVGMLNRQNGQQQGPIAPGQTTQDVSARPGETMQQVEQAGPPTSAMGPDAWVTRFATAQQNPKMVAQIAYDPNAPKWVREMAEQNLGTQIQNKREQQTAEQLVNQSVQSGDMKPLAGAMNSQDGSWVKYYLFNRLGLGSAAQNEANKLGLMDKTVAATGPDGEYGLLKVNGRGDPVGGVRADGTPLTQQEALQWASLGEKNSSMLKTAQTQAQQAAANLGEKMRANEIGGFKYAPGAIDQAMVNAYQSTYANITGGRRPFGITSNAQSAISAQTPTSTNQPAANQPAANQPAANQPAVKDSAYYNQIENYGEQRPDDTPNTLNRRRNELAKIDPAAVHSDAQAVANYDQDPKALNRGQTYRQFVLTEARKINPNYSDIDYGKNKKVIEEYNSTKPNTAGANLVALNTVIGHGQEVLDANADLRNMRIPAVNRITNTISTAFGDGRTITFDAAKDIYAGEVVKVIRGNGGALADQEAAKAHVMSQSNPEQLTSVIKEYNKLFASKVDALRGPYERTGRKDFDNFLMEPTKKALAEANAEKAARHPTAGGTPAGYSDKDKEARYQAWKARQGQQR